MKTRLLIPFAAIAMFTSCKKEYITNEYITNEYVYNSEYYSTILNQQEEITNVIRPDYLKKGDTIAVCASSNAVSKKDLSDGIELLKSWGLVVVEADNLYNVDGRYAGTLSERVEGMQKMIDNPNIKAIIMARGGYGMAMTLPYLDLDPLKSNPKWVVGYSDVTALLAAINNLGVEAIHGPMVKGLADDKDSYESLRNALFGKQDKLTIKTNTNCVIGKAEGRLVGGNLSIIYSLGGTLFDLNCKNSILLIEDTGEHNYSVDRMLTNLKLSGKLNAVSGIIVGDFNTIQGNDKSIEEIIKEKCGDLDIPIMYGANISHTSKNLAVYTGRVIRLTVDEENATIEF